MSFIVDNHESWNAFFSSTIIQQKLQKADSQLCPEDYYPAEENVFRFAKVNLAGIKYIIVGLEPYPSCGIDRITGDIVPIATGRSFEVSNLLTWDEKFKQSSLRNILKTIYYNETGKMASLDTIRDKIRDGEFLIAQPNQWFNRMENQGVLFLNASLTVKRGKTDTHGKIWEAFMNELIRYITGHTRDVQWLLWGNKAYERVSPFVPNEQIIRSCHPRLDAFVKENCFAYADKVNWLG